MLHSDQTIQHHCVARKFLGVSGDDFPDHIPLMAVPSSAPEHLRTQQPGRYTLASIESELPPVQLDSSRNFECIGYGLNLLAIYHSVISFNYPQHRAPQWYYNDVALKASLGILVDF